MNSAARRWAVVAAAAKPVVGQAWQVTSQVEDSFGGAATSVGRPWATSMVTTAGTWSDIGDCCRAALTELVVSHLAHTTAAVAPTVAPRPRADVEPRSRSSGASDGPSAASCVYSAETDWLVSLSAASMDATDSPGGFVALAGVPAALGGPCVSSSDAFGVRALPAPARDGALERFALSVAATVVPDAAEVD